MMINELIEQIGRERLELFSEYAPNQVKGPVTFREVKMMARALLAVLDAQENNTIRKRKALLWLERQQVAHPGMNEVRYAIELITAPPVASVHLQITDEMALAFHQAIGDGSIGSADVAEIKTGLASAFANVTFPPSASAPDGLAAAVNRLLDSDGSRGTFSAIRRSDALAEVERLLAAAPATGVPDALREAVNAIYFTDSSDYFSALWSIVRFLSPETADLFAKDERAAFERVNANLQHAAAPAPGGDDE